MVPSKYVDCLLLMTTALTSSNNTSGEYYRGNGYDGNNVRVNVTIVIDELKITNPRDMIIQMSGLLIQEWYDASLSQDAFSTRKKATRGQIWSPKITNVNGNDLLRNEYKSETLFWRGYGARGHVYHGVRFLIETYCTNDLTRFPFDVNDCTFKFGTYRFPSEEVELTWTDRVTGVDLTNRNINDFYVIDYARTYESDNYAPFVGNFTRLSLMVRIHRNSLHYVYCIIIPSILAIVLDYLTLWIDLVERDEEEEEDEEEYDVVDDCRVEEDADSKVGDGEEIRMTKLRDHNRYGRNRKRLTYRRQNQNRRRLSINLVTFTYQLYIYYVNICNNASLTIVNYLKFLDVFALIALFFAGILLFNSWLSSLSTNRFVNGKRPFRDDNKFDRCLRVIYLIFYVLINTLLSYVYLT